MVTKVWARLQGCVAFDALTGHTCTGAMAVAQRWQGVVRCTAAVLAVLTTLLMFT